MKRKEIKKAYDAIVAMADLPAKVKALEDLVKKIPTSLQTELQSVKDELARTQQALADLQNQVNNPPVAPVAPEPLPT